MTKPALKNELNETKQWFESLNQANSQKRDCLKDRKELEQMVEKMQKELLDLRDDHRYSKERLRAIEVGLPDKVEKYELVEIKDFLQLLPTKEEVTTLRHYMRNNIDKFAEDNTNFKNQFEEHLEIIRRYDEVISEKASKHSVYELESRVNDSYKPVMKDMDERIQVNLKLIHETKECF